MMKSDAGIERTDNLAVALVDLARDCGANFKVIRHPNGDYGVEVSGKLTSGKGCYRTHHDAALAYLRAAVANK